MNYEKLYYKLCEYCKNTDVKDRIRKRNANDERLVNDCIYYEVHHIVPKHSGGTNEKDNLVMMLPEEHFMAHLIRYYAYKNTNDFLSVRFTINGYTNKPKLEYKIPKNTLNKMVMTFKSNIRYFKSNNNWHTDRGIKSISKARKNKMPAIDAKTNKIIGSVKVDHPKILSGEWIHITKGRVSCYDTQTKEKVYIRIEERRKDPQRYIPSVGDVRGELNPNYSGIGDDEILNIMIDANKKANLDFIITYNIIAKHYRNKYSIKLPIHLSKFRFGGMGIAGLNKLISEKTNKPLDLYYNNNPIKRELVKQALNQI